MYRKINLFLSEKVCRHYITLLNPSEFFLPAIFHKVQLSTSLVPCLSQLFYPLQVDLLAIVSMYLFSFNFTFHRPQQQMQ